MKNNNNARKRGFESSDFSISPTLSETISLSKLPISERVIGRNSYFICLDKEFLYNSQEIKMYDSLMTG